MNDPNGTIHHAGWYHLFFQHDPDRDTWGRMHWGHARSRDLVRWERLPIALTPDAALGEDHCFSGNAWRDEEGRVLLFYTSVRGDHDGFTTEQWAVRANDAFDSFRRVDTNPIIKPPLSGRLEFGPTARDPFVFEREGRTFLILGADLPGEDGAPVIPLYEATGPELLRWAYRGVMYRPLSSERRFLECPNLLRVHDADVLVVSPHGPVEYMVGHFDPSSGTFESSRAGRLDESPDFYATSQFALEETDEPAVVGWVRGWSPGRGWNGVLSLPRRTSLSPDGDLLQRPEPALAALRGRVCETRKFELSAGQSLRSEAGAASSFEMEATTGLGSGTGGLRLVEKERGSTVLELSIAAGGTRADLGGCAFDLPDMADGRHRFRLFWDRSIAELFVDDGRRVCTRVVDTASGAPVCVEWFCGEGRLEVESSTSWPLAGIW
jgi:beta-fructofuranosidase